MSPEEIDQSKLVDKAMSAFRWVAALRFMGQLVSWLSTILVIRFLAPEDYGIMSLAEVFRTFLVFFSTMGLGEGLMRVAKLTPALVKKTLGILVLINGLLFLLQFFAAPYIAVFYGNQELELVLQVLAVTYLLLPWTCVPSNLIARNLNHKETSKITFISSVLSSALSLALAYLGYGYWALIAAIIFQAFFNCFWFNRLLKYPRVPSFVFSGAGEIFRFGALIAVADLLFVAYSKVDVAMAGKFFDIAEIGMYAVAIQLATMLMTKSVPLFNVVAFPAFARMSVISDDGNEYLITTLRFAAMLIFPIFLGIAMLGEDLIGLVLGDTWVQISGLFAIIVVSVPLRIIAYVISPAMLVAPGGARLNMINALATLLVLTVAIFLLLPLGLYGVAIAWSIASVCLFLLTVVTGGRHLSISIAVIIDTFLPALLVSVIMCLVIYAVDLQLDGVSGFLALYKVPLGGMVYVAIFWYVFRDRAKELLRVSMRLAGRR